MAFRWNFYPEKPDLQEQIARSAVLSRLAARVLVNRGIQSPAEAAEFLNAGLSGLTDPFRMNRMEAAVERILAALKGKQRIVVYGDSDVDGVAGTALLAGFLRAVGGNVSTYIPDRLEEGYSLTDRGVATILERGADVVITVDNGTSAVGPVAELTAHGIDVIITDHHESADRVPVALAILNPKLPDSGYPFPHLCGTAVAFQLLSALAARLPARGSTQDAMHDLLRHSIAFVAMATICDCVPLVGENRAFARAGLNALKGTEHPGLRALLTESGVAREVQPDDISFRLGPRINAAGRLGQAERALALLLSQDKDEAKALAQELDRRNSERQQIEAEILADARRVAASSIGPNDPVIVLADEKWHAGVVGIVAARLATEFNRPAVLIAWSGATGRGSGRSVPGFDLYQALARCAEHLIGFGGHANAAGLELSVDSFDDFREAMLRNAAEAFTGVPERELLIDAEVPLGVLSPSLMVEVNQLAPFGEGLPDPIFAAVDLTLDGAPRIVGKNRSHLSFSVQQAGVRRKAIAYGLAHRLDDLRLAATFSVAFTPRLNLFRGQVNVELDVKDIHVPEES